MKTNSAFWAPASAPDTGASTIATPLAANRPAVLRVYQGSEDDVSNSRQPLPNPSARPSGPNTTASTSRPCGNMVTTTSEAAATSLGQETKAAPGVLARKRSTALRST